MKIHAPLLPLAACMIAGITTSQWINDWLMALAMLVIVVIATCMVGHYPRLQTAGLLAGMFLLGVALGSRQRQHLNAEWPEKTQSTQLVVVSEVKVKKKTVVFDALTADGQHKLRCSIHRDNNTDNPDRLHAIIQALADVGMQDNIPIVLPLHPRTKKILDNSQFSILNSQFLHIIPPASFLDITLLEQHAKIVMTDSGGVQKEAFFFERPCIILRPETEWVEIVNHGAGIIADADHDRIVAAYRQLADHPVHFPHLFGDGHASEKILQTILDN